MNGTELRDIIGRVGLTQVGTARFLGMADSTVRRWISDRNPVPVHVEMLLRVMAKYKLSPDNVEALVRRN